MPTTTTDGGPFDGPGGPGAGNGDPPPPIPDNNVGTANDDQFFWTPIDNPQVLDGFGGNDVMFMSTGTGADTVSLFSVAAAAGPAHADIAFNGLTVLDLVNVETIDIRTLEGADTVTIGDFSATNVGTVNLDLSAATFLPDGAADRVTIVAANSGSQISVTPGVGGSQLQVLDQAGGALKAISVSNLDASDQVTLQGSGAADTITIGAGAITPKVIVHGGGGADSIVGGLGPETISGDFGNDTIQAAAGTSIVTGDDGDDVLISAQGVIASGGNGNDTVTGAFNDVIQGGVGDDVLIAGASTRADGGVGNDTITTNGSANGAQLAGGDGADSLVGNNNSVSFDGGAGNDVIAWQLNGAQSSHTAVNGGADTDTLLVQGVQNATPWQVDLTSNAGVDSLRLINSATGAAIDTTLFLSNLENVSLRGGQGQDTFTINDQTGTGVQKVDIDLGIGGAADGKVDHVTLNASAGADTVTVSAGAGGALVVAGLPETVTIHGLDSGAAGSADVVQIRTGAGDDVIDLRGLTGGAQLGEIHVDAGAGHNTITAGAGAFIYAFDVGSQAVDTVNGWTSHDNGGTNRIDLTTFGDHSLSDLVQHGHLVFTTDGNSVLTDGAGTTITFLHTTLVSGDFIFG